MSAGRPKQVDPSVLYSFAHVFYWEWKTLAEGAYRWYVDRPQFEKLKSEAEATRLTAEQRSALSQGLSEEIRKGWLSSDDRDKRLHELKEGLLFDIKFAKHSTAADLSRKPVRVPGEPDIIARLLSATRPEQVVEICGDAFTTFSIKSEAGEEIEGRAQNWPVARLPMYLSEHAVEFIEAKNDPRFPKSTRPSTQLKQFWFLSRALAGAEYGVTTRTAINLVGSMHPDMMFHQSRDGKPARKQRKAKQIATRQH
jgi:hypothetical protein